LTTDLVKGSDIEIQLHITDSRTLNTSVFLVMTQQEFKNVFSVSEKQISLDRLRDQYNQLEAELLQTTRQFQHNENDIWEIKANALLEDLQSVKERLFKLKDGDKSDEKYIIAEKIMRTSQAADKLGGNERISMLIEEYFEAKERLTEAINSSDFEKQEMRKKFQKIEQSEDSFIRSKNVSFIENKIKQLHDLHWDALCNTTSFLISKYVMWRELPQECYKDYAAARSLIRMADASLEKEKYAEFRSQVFSLTHLMVIIDHHINKDFKGTGIG
jgi:molecular chaperone DnaK